jgi:GMP-PDE, delta subunit
VDFLEFRVRDMKSKKVLFQHSAPENLPVLTMEQRSQLDDASRTVAYDFGSKFFDLKQIATQLRFRIGGQKPLKSFRMIERHYFADTLVHSWDFDMGFCIPGTENTAEFMYDVPKLAKAMGESSNPSRNTLQTGRAFIHHPSGLLRTGILFCSLCAPLPSEGHDREPWQDCVR